MKLDKVVLVCKRSAFYFYSKSADERIRDYVTGNSDNAEQLRLAHDNNQRTIDSLTRDVEKMGVKYEALFRENFKGIDLSAADLLITVGGDGTLLDAAHQVTDEIPVFSVNSDPERSVGYFSEANAKNFFEKINGIDNIPVNRLTRIQVTLDSHVLPELVLNDILVAHRNPAAYMRYELLLGEGMEKHRNSGLLVCTAAGSTAFMYNEGGFFMPLDSKAMQYRQRSVRGAQSFFTEQPLRLLSTTREGMIWIDGEHVKYEFKAGSELALSRGTPLTLIANLEQKRRERYGIDYERVIL